MIEAWMMILRDYGPYIKQMGKKYVRIAAVDASLIKLLLAAFSWATYREKTGAVKITCVLDWVQGVPPLVRPADCAAQSFARCLCPGLCADQTLCFPGTLHPSP